MPFEVALAAAEAAARERCPGFDPGSWVLDWRDDGTDIHGYCFNWWPVINEFGLKEPYPLTVYVDGLSGEVVSIFLPPRRVTGPTPRSRSRLRVSWRRKRRPSIRRRSHSTRRS